MASHNTLSSYSHSVVRDRPGKSPFLLRCLLERRYRRVLLNKPKGYTFAKGRHPHRPGACEFKIPTQLIEGYLRYGPAHKFFDLYTVQHILQYPRVIFEGLEREEQEHGLCYAGIPPFIRRESRASMMPGAEVQLVELAPPEGMTFAVFANSQYVVFDWRWEAMDGKNLGYPIDWDARFRRRLWPT